MTARRTEEKQIFFNKCTDMSHNKNHKKNYTMKKQYTSPHTDFIELGTFNLIAVSIPGKPNTGNDDDKWANEYDAGEYRSDWENIWADM